MSTMKIEHPSVDERRAQGKKSRKQVSPSNHAGWKPAADRPDPVALLEEQDATREPDLVPVRHGRMMVSPFTFYRGAAKIMAADLKDTPQAGLAAQLWRLHEGAEDPQNREEDPEEEHPAVSISERCKPERERNEQVQKEAAETDSPPHSSSFYC